MPFQQMRRFLYFVVVVALCVGALYKWKADRDRSGRATTPVGGEEFTGASKPRLKLSDVELLSRLDQEYTRLIDAVTPSVVSVTTSRYVEMMPRNPNLFFDFFAPKYRGVVPGLGSGVIVSKEGHILTNYHVVKDVDEIKVQLQDGRIRDARIVGVDQELDIAVLKMEAGEVTPLSFGNSDSVKVGQMVFAIGSPFGLEETVTSGIVSAIGRRAVSDASKEFIQTNADINPGNSGGPLVNLRGEIIGINTMIFSQSGGSQGIGFAIPGNAARHSMSSILATGKVVRGYLGIVMTPLTPELAEHYGAERGALVDGVVENSPAAGAGLKRGDVISEFNGKPVRNIADLRNKVLELAVGDKVKLSLLREGKPQSVELEIAKAPDDYFTARAPLVTPPATSAQASPLAGVTVSEIPPALRQKLSPNIGGVYVTRVDSRSRAAGVLRPGDIIEEVKREPISSVSEFERAAGQLAPGEEALLSIIRGRARSFVVIP